MNLGKLFTIIFVILLLSGNVFAEGSKFDRFATDAETTAQTRDDVGITPSNIPSIMAAPGTVSELKLDHTVETLNADRTILITDNPVLWFDCNGSDRNVTLPAMASNSTNLVFTIVNRSDGAGEDLVVRDGNATPVTLFTIGPEQGQRFSCDGTDWETWFDSGIRYDGVKDSLTFVTNSVDRFSLRNLYLEAVITQGPRLAWETSSSTNPVFVNRSDSDTGMGFAGTNQPAIISGGIPSQVWGTVITLSTAQVNALQATPITIVAAQGANTWIELVTAIITYDYAIAAFTVAAGEDLVIEYGDGTDVTASIETTGFLDQTDDEIRYYPFVLAAGADPEATINQVLRIKNTGAGEIADGGGEVDIRVVYRVYTTGF